MFEPLHFGRHFHFNNLAQIRILLQIFICSGSPSQYTNTGLQHSLDLLRAYLSLGKVGWVLELGSFLDSAIFLMKMKQEKCGKDTWLSFLYFEPIVDHFSCMLYGSYETIWIHTMRSVWIVQPWQVWICLSKL